MSEDNAYPEKWRQLEYVGERGTWSPDRTMSYACEERIRYDQIEKDNDRLSERAGHLDNELQIHKRRLAKKDSYIKKLEDENKELKKMIEDMQTSFMNKQQDMEAQLDWFHKSLEITEKQRDEAQQNHKMLQASFDVCAANNVAYVQENQEFKKANDQLAESNQQLAEASLKCVAIQKKALQQRKEISRCFIQVLKENVDVRSVLEEHLKQENKYRRRLHEEQLNIEEILKSTQTADKHRNDPDIDKFDEMNKLE